MSTYPQRGHRTRLGSEDAVRSGVVGPSIEVGGGIVVVSPIECQASGLDVAEPEGAELVDAPLHEAVLLGVLENGFIGHGR